MKLILTCIFSLFGFTAFAFEPVCYKAEFKKDKAPDYISYYKKFCITEISWQVLADSVRVDYSIYLESYVPVWGTYNGVVKNYQVYAKDILGGKRWPLIPVKYPRSYVACPGGRCGSDFEVAIEGINASLDSSKVKFFGDGKLYEKDPRESFNRGFWPVKYIPE